MVHSELQDDAGGLEEEEARGAPDLGIPHAGDAPGGVKQSRLEKRDVHGDDLGEKCLLVEIAVINQILCGSNELKAKRLMPPRTPPAGQTSIKDVGEGAKDGGVLPKLTTSWEQRAEGEELVQVVEVEYGLDGGIDAA